jgi:hypothetical protein
VTKHGKVVIHKAKRNNNLSFSKGKTWNLEDMRALEVITVCLSHCLGPRTTACSLESKMALAPFFWCLSECP